jgi:tRNA pseudouridine38-40 synthase
MRAASADWSFDSRRAAVSREYRYFIWNSPTCHPHIKPYVLWLKGHHYDWNRAGTVAPLLIGEHDFAAFCRAGDRPENTTRKVTASSLKKRGGLIVFRIRANSYLTNMVRIAVGNIIAVASGKRDENWFVSLLRENEGRDGAKIATPGGLFLWSVDYGYDIFKSKDR